MAVSNPMVPPTEPAPAISKTTLPIAGLFVDIYGLAELPAAATSVTVLWLHHPRLNKKEDMADVAAMTVAAWNARRPARGLIAAAFDQRNHGTRLVSEIANKAWREGNKTHAQDMFGMVSGTVVDTSHLMDGLEGYLFSGGGGPAGAQGRGRKVDHHVGLGVSVGGHSIWQLMFSDPRCVAGVMVLGCPDYAYLMADRARLSKLETFSKADNGASFIGSKDFPAALVDACKKYDPKSLLFGTGDIPQSPSPAERERLKSLLDARIRGKKFQILSGGSDKLVPFAKSEPFVSFLQNAGETWSADSGFSVENIVYPEVKHDFTQDMVKDAIRFIIDAVAEADGAPVASAKI